MSGTGTVSQAISLSGLPFRPPLPSLPVVVLALFASPGRTPRPSTQAGAGACTLFVSGYECLSVLLRLGLFQNN